MIRKITQQVTLQEDVYIQEFLHSDLLVIKFNFNSGAISEKVLGEFRVYIEDMRYSFGLLDYDIKSINSKTEDNESLDSVRVNDGRKEMTVKMYMYWQIFMLMKRFFQKSILII